MTDVDFSKKTALCLFRASFYFENGSAYFSRSGTSKSQEVDFTEKSKMSLRSTSSFVLQGPLK